MGRVMRAGQTPSAPKAAAGAAPLPDHLTLSAASTATGRLGQVGQKTCLLAGCEAQSHRSLLQLRFCSSKHC